MQILVNETCIFLNTVYLKNITTNINHVMFCYTICVVYHVQQESDC